MTTVLITGARGFIAQHLAPAFRAAGFRTVGTSRHSADVPGFDRVVQASLGQSLLPVMEAQQIDALIHCALDDRPNSYHANVSGTGRWFAEARDRGVHLQVLLSSLSASPDALSDYGRAKFALEQVFLSHNQVVFRMGLVIGNGGMFARLVASSRRYPAVPLLDGGRQLIYILGIEFVCQLLTDCIARGGSGFRGRPWHIQQPRPYTLRDVVEAIHQEYGYRRLLVTIPARPVELGLQLLEKLPAIHLPISSANVGGLIQQGQKRFQSDFPGLGYPEQSLEDLIHRVALESQGSASQA